MEDLIIKCFSLREVDRVIKDTIYGCKIGIGNIDIHNYHHNIKYNDIPSSIKNGLLSFSEQYKLEGKKVSEEDRYRYEDDCYVNGLYNISLAREIDDIKTGNNNFVYDWANSDAGDIVISNKIHASRNTKNYVNEYLARNKIDSKYFESIDIRILNFLSDKSLNYNYNSEIKKIARLLELYSYLKQIAQTLIDYKSGIALREVSKDCIILDPQKVLKMPNVRLYGLN